MLRRSVRRALLAPFRKWEFQSYASSGFPSDGTLSPHEKKRTKTAPQYACLEESRGVLRLAGRDIFSYLQGLLSNDVWLIDTEDPKPLYAAKLNPKGRVQYDVILHPSNRKAGDELSVFMEVGKECMAELQKMLVWYRLRAVVDVQDVSDDFKVWALFGENFGNPEGLPIDPRLPSLGARFIRPSTWNPGVQQKSDLEWSSLYVTNENEMKEGTPSDYKYWRVRHGVGEGPIEIPSGGALPLEHNMDVLNGVSFTKGCYVGQELTARTHFQGRIRKRLMPAKILSGLTGVGEAVILEPGGKSIGEVRAVERNYALVFLRLEPTVQAISGGAGHLLTDSSLSEIEPQVPGWWPPKWITDEASLEQN
ncbi:hypothetical protein BSKO_06005 [Bryopsis sp. KO-2023]|nr:hypothetical protein BSKO_06005 [Bryopsis sp. KO-2023]